MIFIVWLFNGLIAGDGDMSLNNIICIYSAGFQLNVGAFADVRVPRVLDTPKDLSGDPRGE